MWVMHVERIQGSYVEPEIIDLKDGTGCLFRLHETDIGESGPSMLADLLTHQAQRWAPRPPGTLGPVIPVRWDRVRDLPSPFLMGVDEGPDAVTYTIGAAIISQHAADCLGKLGTERSPHWQRVPEGYRDDRTRGAE